MQKKQLWSIFLYENKLDHKAISNINKAKVKKPEKNLRYNDSFQNFKMKFLKIKVVGSW